MKLSNTGSRVLLLEDDPVDRLNVRRQLEDLDISVYDTNNPDEAKAIFLERVYDCVLIHVGKHPLAGLDFCRWIRSKSIVPIIMFTSRDEVVNELMCTNAGADDYIIKPIEPRILRSRIMQQITNSEIENIGSKTKLTWGNLELDTYRRVLTYSNIEITLTNTEYRFLQTLMAEPERVFTKDEMLEAIHVMPGIGTSHLLDTHASRIRRKVLDAGGPHIISVVRSVGFRLSSNKENSKRVS